MSAVVDRMDPALKKLLDELPQSDPDRITVRLWIDQCPNQHVVPAGSRVSLIFGQWCGPRTHYSNIVIHAEYSDGRHGSGSIGGVYEPSVDGGFVQPGFVVQADLLIAP